MPSMTTLLWFWSLEQSSPLWRDKISLLGEQVVSLFFIRPAYFQQSAKIHVPRPPHLVVLVNRTVLSSLINYNKYVILRLSALLKPARPLHPRPDLHAYLCDPLQPDQGPHPE